MDDQVETKLHEQNRAQTSIRHIWAKRSSILVVLMLFQSVSSMVMSKFDDVLKENVEITLFLTMLIGQWLSFGSFKECPFRSWR